MAHSLSLDEPLDRSLKAIAIEKLDSAIAALESQGDRSQAIFEARKNMKRARSVLRLARPLIKDKILKREDKRLSRAARRLSEARDAKAVLDIAARLEEIAGKEAERALFADLRRWLQARVELAERHLESEALEASLADLKASRDEIGSLSFKALPFDSLLGAARETYAEARKAMRSAFAKENAAEYHDWRKAAQHHWQQMRLLQEAWPVEDCGRIALVRDLAHLLGEHHDLSVLKDVILANAASCDRPGDYLRLAELIEARQSALLAEAAPFGEQIFAEKPKAFLKRLTESLESAARSGQGSPAAVSRSPI
jgi:CHAD domain-containing protein